MLRKNNKLSRDDFTTIFKKGKVYHSSHFSFRIAKERSWKDARFAVVISKKVEKGAAMRNKSKRRVYYCVRALLPILKSPTSSIITIKKPIKGVKHEVIRDEILGIFQKS